MMRLDKLAGQSNFAGIKESSFKTYYDRYPELKKMLEDLIRNKDFVQLVQEYPKLQNSNNEPSMQQNIVQINQRIKKEIQNMNENV